MNIKTLTRRGSMLVLVLLCATVVVVAATTFLTVSPTNLQGWQIQVSASPSPTPSVTFVNGPATPPLGTGSAEFRVGPHGNSAAQLRHPGYAGTLLPNPSPTQPPAANELSSLNYWTFTQQDGSGGQSPYINLLVDYNNDNVIDDQLFFEPVYQSATFCPSNPQPALVTGQWQQWDAFNGCWWSLNNTAGAGPGSNTKPLRTITAAQPNARIVNSSTGLGGVRIITGFGSPPWDNYVGNVDAFRIGVGANDTVYNFDPAETTPTVGPPATLTISETRFRGPNGVEDEFIEVFNNSTSAHVVSPPDGSSGYSVVGSDGVVRGTIPFGTVIPGRGHYLFANSDGYSLGAYPAGHNTTATPDATYTADLPNDNTAGVALFTTSNPANMTLANRFDAFGFTGAPALYREGTGFATVVSDTSQHTYYRDLRPGAPKDTNNNSVDFSLVAADTTTPNIPLGAPGPQNRIAPSLRTGSQFPAQLIDGGVSSASYPNRERRPGEVGTNADLGTLYVRRMFTNNTGDFVVRLRYRIVELTTLNSPAVCGPSGTSLCADLRALTSQTEVVTQSSSGTVTVEGLTLEEPPTQALGGGNNSSLSADGFVNLDVPLAPGASVFVNFKTGVMRGGTFRFFVLVEAQTCTEAGVNCTPSPERPAVGAPGIPLGEQ